MARATPSSEARKSPSTCLMSTNRCCPEGWWSTPSASS
eukprot:CAMPEP_0172559222 /NCGR_PEP_ID=MMETSP1067-20121228/83037_1 /TAXON_ID=265564 ORGANISM="Thalassiosira punctigera, Strain Tpunct2005C2" /NCGR_SAMPLE_ID=MMETSP1067 /ASSEMBLY_ACC=CAM_ASM_000444 /LENGTH=37 /DNA_ID= /DNA_START= /DNA_END= /DNA_ORIENTATION=